jgi:hypothetical protein
MRNYSIEKSVADVAKRLIDTNFAGTILAGAQETESDYSYGLMFDDGYCDIGHEMPDESAYASNERNHLRLYKLEEAGVNVIVETGENDFVFIMPPTATIKDFLMDYWDFGDVDPYTGMAEFGFDAGPEDASPGDRDVRIWRRPCYYAGTLGAPRADYVREGTYWAYPRVFSTYEEAQSWIDAAESGVYVTSHGEAGRPEYRIVK